MNKLLIAALFTAGLASATVPALAQTANPPTSAPHARHADKGHHARGPMQLPGERVEARLAYIQTALKITAAQKTQWDNFAAVMRKHARDADKRIQERRAQMAQNAKREPLDTIARLERRQQMMATRAQNMNELIAAGKPLYAALTPEQKQVADGLLTPRHGRGGHGGHRGMRGNA
jgi:Spy/CpxP family protein refolding chaperone